MTRASDLTGVTENVTTCQLCRRPLPPGSSPRARYCSGACRTAAWRRRHSLAWPKFEDLRPEDQARILALEAFLLEFRPAPVESPGADGRVPQEGLPEG